MSPETRALLRLDGRRLGWMGPAALAALAATSALVIFLSNFRTPGGREMPWMELIMVGLVPLLAAGVGAAGPGGDQDRPALDWLRARAVTPRRLLASSLAWQLLAVALLFFLSAMALFSPAWLLALLFDQHGWPEAFPAWSSLLDAPPASLILLSQLMLVSCFAWALALSWWGQRATTAQLGGLLLGWGQVAALLVPSNLLGGGAREALEHGDWLLPCLAVLPALVALWAWHRWDPLAGPLPRRQAVVLAAAGLLLGVLGIGLALAPAMEARSLSAAGAPQVLRGVASVRSLVNPQTPALVAHELTLQDGTTRVRLDDGVARREVLPRGTTAVGWYVYGRTQQFVVDFGHGRWRRLRPDGSTGPPPPEAHEDLAKYWEARR